MTGILQALSGVVHGPVSPQFRERLHQIFGHELFAPREGLTYQEKVRLTYDQLKLVNSMTPVRRTGRPGPRGHVSRAAAPNLSRRPDL
ncbi:hypothetical protein JOF56_007474 [Kibdelosporangium banguiense]|uniref:Uncharacterized protein n=1 Tax=Kibdelosporangium banguiense TaxID=1365924 RepID=A0ABS4TRQ6_9PSEU|nr:hypothetical protein [Kibdelosporangium banguiense]MBP2327089.1 hypothetical protein [Kibdelosporangium banguiense]